MYPEKNISQVKHVVITPVFNEADKIADLIRSLAAQALPPTEWVIVDDGSTDNTAEVVSGFVRQFPWIRLVTHLKDSSHASGSKIAKACIFGYGQIQTPHFDFVTKLDADLVLPPEYFKQIALEFLTQERVGLCGGVCVIEQNGQMVVESVADPDHVRGALKSYRKTAYEAIGGIRPVEGWDTLDELLVQYHGFEVKVRQDLHVLHKRVTDTHTGPYKAPIKSGRSFYKIGYNFLVASVSAAKMWNRRPVPFAPILAMYGYLSCVFGSEKRETDKRERAFINHYRIQKFLKKLKLK